MNKPLIVKLPLIYEDYPLLSISEDTEGNLFLDYLLEYKDIGKESRLIQAVTKDDVDFIKKYDEPIINLFKSETPKLYIERVVSSNEIETIEEVTDLSEYERFFSQDEYINYPLGYIAPLFGEQSAVTLAKTKERLIINLYAKEASDEKEVSAGVLSEIFIPVIELIKKELGISKRTENSVMFLSNFSSGSLGGNIEIKVNRSLLDVESNEFLKVKRVINLIDSSSEEDLHFASSNMDDSYIEQYKKVLNYVIKNKVGIYTSLSDPKSTKPISARLFYNKAIKVKKILDARIVPDIEIDEVEAVWGEVNVISQKTHFTIKEIGSDVPIVGVCSDEVLRKLKTKGVLFGNDERVYKFNLKITHYAATSSRKEKMTYTMLDYNLVDRQPSHVIQSRIELPE